MVAKRHLPLTVMAAPFAQAMRESLPRFPWEPRRAPRSEQRKPNDNVSGNAARSVKRPGIEG